MSKTSGNQDLSVPSSSGVATQPTWTREILDPIKTACTAALTSKSSALNAEEQLRRNRNGPEGATIRAQYLGHWEDVYKHLSEAQQKASLLPSGFPSITLSMAESIRNATSGEMTDNWKDWIGEACKLREFCNAAQTVRVFESCKSRYSSWIDSRIKKLTERLHSSGYQEEEIEVASAHRGKLDSQMLVEIFSDPGEKEFIVQEIARINKKREEDNIVWDSKIQQGIGKANEWNSLLGFTFPVTSGTLCQVAICAEPFPVESEEERERMCNDIEEYESGRIFQELKNCPASDLEDDWVLYAFYTTMSACLETDPSATFLTDCKMNKDICFALPNGL